MAYLENCSLVEFLVISPTRDAHVLEFLLVHPRTGICDQLFQSLPALIIRLIPI